MFRWLCYWYVFILFLLWLNMWCRYVTVANGTTIAYSLCRGYGLVLGNLPFENSSETKIVLREEQ
jgi:hypothetical protein